MRYDQISPIPPLTKVTKSIIIACVVIYVADFVLSSLGFTLFGLELAQVFGIVPRFIIERGWVFQFFTYMFFHGSPFHILLNMLILWYFGAEIEMRMGAKGFLAYFLICGMGAGLFNFGVNVAFGDVTRISPIIGCSGAIYGILAAYAIFFGERYFLVFFLFPMKAKHFVLIIAAMELFTGAQKDPRDNVAHFAHLGGMVVGAIYTWLRYGSPWGGSKMSKKDAERERLKRQFTLIVNDSQDSKDDEKGPYWN